jgi:hypothetical protein
MSRLFVSYCYNSLGIKLALAESLSCCYLSNSKPTPTPNLYNTMYTIDRGEKGVLLVRLTWDHTESLHQELAQIAKGIQSDEGGAVYSIENKWNLIHVLSRNL